jgi:hypothetical protein
MRAALVISRRVARSGSGGNHRDDSVRARIHDENIIADQDVVRDIAGRIPRSEPAAGKDGLFSELPAFAYLIPMSSKLMIVGSVCAQDTAQCASPNTMIWSRHCRRIEPMNLST